MTRHRYTARKADVHDLYEKSVQDPVPDIALLARWFERTRGRVARTLREDFGGTAFFCAEWIKSDARRRAIAVDLDARTMAWGRRRHFKPANAEGADPRRMTFLRANVLTARTPPVDLACAFNFSWCVFLERRTLVDYFRAARAALVRDGLFALDLHGGPSAWATCKDERRMGGFTYVWDQGPVDAITHRSIRRIHFDFPDGSRRRNVYRYDWRIWTLPETREALLDAGFRKVDVLWELYDKEGEGSGIFRRVDRAKNEESWVAYLLAWR
jgi:hypothetical protein